MATAGSSIDGEVPDKSTRVPTSKAPIPPPVKTNNNANYGALHTEPCKPKGESALAIVASYVGRFLRMLFFCVLTQSCLYRARGANEEQPAKPRVIIDQLPTAADEKPKRRFRPGHPNVWTREELDNMRRWKTGRSTRPGRYGGWRFW